MRASRIAGILAIFALMASAAMAQSASSVVKASGVLSVDKVRQGSSFQVAVIIQIEQGYHVNSNRPGDKNLIPTSLKVDSLAGVTTGPINYPAGKSRKFEFSKTPLMVYDGRVVLKFTARALPSLAVGSHTLNARLTVQPCNDQACMMPGTITIGIPIEVVPAGTKTSSVNGDVFGTPRAKKR